MKRMSKIFILITVTFMISFLFYCWYYGAQHFAYRAARGNMLKTLKLFYNEQNEYFDKNNKFANKFDELNIIFKYDILAYTYFMGNDIFMPDTHFGPKRYLPEEYQKEISNNKFIIYAVADFDFDDNELDIWSLNNNGEIRQLENDYDSCIFYIIKKVKNESCTLYDSH